MMALTCVAPLTRRTSRQIANIDSVDDAHALVAQRNARVFGKREGHLSPPKIRRAIDAIGHPTRPEGVRGFPRNAVVIIAHHRAEAARDRLIPDGPCRIRDQAAPLACGTGAQRPTLVDIPVGLHGETAVLQVKRGVRGVKFPPTARCAETPFRREALAARSQRQTRPLKSAKNLKFSAHATEACIR